MFAKRPKPPKTDQYARSQAERRAAAIAHAILRRQVQAARLLSSRFERLPLWGRKCCLLAFCLLLGTASAWQLLQATRPLTAAEYPVPGSRNAPADSLAQPSPIPYPPLKLDNR